jgi:hypothetical protein
MATKKAKKTTKRLAVVYTMSSLGAPKENAGFGKTQCSSIF